MIAGDGPSCSCGKNGGLKLTSEGLCPVHKEGTAGNISRRKDEIANLRSALSEAITLLETGVCPTCGESYSEDLAFPECDDVNHSHVYARIEHFKKLLE